MENKVVAHFRDGRVQKGVTQDFDPSGETFYLLPAEGGGVPSRVRIEELKALFYVRDYLGNRDFVTRRDFEEAQRTGRRVIVKFHDGEEIWGTVTEIAEQAPGFFLHPVDSRDNNIKVFVVRSSLEDLKWVE